MSIEASPDVIHTHQLNYKPVQEANCKYRFIRIPLNNVTSSSVTIGASTTQLLEWKLPTAVYNLSQSYVSYTESIPAPGAGDYNWICEDSIGLASNIYFGNASGADLCNLNFANKYVKIARKLNTSMTDFLTLDAQTSLLNPVNTLIDNIQALYPVSGQNIANNTQGSVNYLEPQYLYNNGNAGAVVRGRLFKLGSVPDTILSVDKDMYIPIDMFLRINAGPGNGYVFRTTGALPTSTPVAYAGDVALTNIYLYLAVETNQLIIDSVMSKVRSTGLTLNIPYTTGFRNSSTGSVANVNIPLSSQYGKKLKQILTTVWNGTESSNTALDCGNFGGRAGDATAIAGTKIQTYNTFLNNRQLQDNAIDCQYGTMGVPNFNDWRENEKHAKGSVIQNRAVYAKNWFHLDKFYEDNKGSIIPEENRQDGYDMSQGPVLYQLQATTVTGTTWIYYQFASFSRDVVLNNQGFLYV